MYPLPIDLLSVGEKHPLVMYPISFFSMLCKVILFLNIVLLTGVIPKQDITLLLVVKNSFVINNFEDKWKYLWIDAWDGGDGCVTQVDPSDNNTVYFSMQNGAIRRKNLKDDISVSIKPKLPKEIEDTLKYNFITPYFISAHNHNHLYHAGNIGPTVMSGRVVDLDVNPNDPANFYVAYASGGLLQISLFSFSIKLAGKKSL